jgi:DNA gyrase subunit B
MSNEIIVLSEVEAIRTNPSMYIGSTSVDGAHHLFYEVVHNSIDESLVSNVTKIFIEIDGDTATVIDDGRGISLSFDEKYKATKAELVLTKLHSGSKFRSRNEMYTAGLHGVGLSCVNALSSVLKIEIKNNGKEFAQVYTRGECSDTQAKANFSFSSGTKLAFTPDKEIFENFHFFNDELISNFIEECSCLNPAIEFTLKNKIGTTIFKSQKGYVEILDKMEKERRLLFKDNLALNLSKNGNDLDIVFNWEIEINNEIKSYVNGVKTFLGGTHVDVFKKALSQSILELYKDKFDRNITDQDLRLEDIELGLLAVIVARVSRPQFESQTKSRLSSEFLYELFSSEIRSSLKKMMLDKQAELNSFFERLNALKKNRLNSIRVAEQVYLKFNKVKINEEVYKKQFGERSKTWHSSAVWITDQKLLESHANMFTENKEAIGLDVCCGSGVVGASFKHKVKKMYGLDLTPEMVALSKTRLDEVVQGNVYQIPFPDNHFDLVCTREVLHLLPQPELPVSEIFRVLKPGGEFIVGQILPFSEVDGPFMYRIFKKKQPLIFNMFQEEDFRRMLLGAGFTNLEISEVVVWENIEVWINSYETTSIHRHEIREIYKNAPQSVRDIHPFKYNSQGEILDAWRWCIFKVKKPK